MTTISRIRATRQGEITTVKALIAHPMDNGFGRDGAGQPVPAHFMTSVELWLNDTLRLRVRTGSGVAADPLFGWRLRDAAIGDRVTVRWQDNRGQRGELHAQVR